MKRLPAIILLSTILMISACKKSSTSASIGHWSFAGTSYNASTATFSKSDSTLSASNDEGKLTVYFPDDQVRSGSYLIVNYDSVPLHDGQVYIRFIQTASSQYYFSTGADAMSADVTLSPSGKINITIPATYLQSYSNPTPYTAQLSGTIHEQ